MEGPEFSRRDILKAIGGALAAGAIPSEAEAGSKSLDAGQKRLVDDIAQEALKKTDKPGRILVSEVQQGALEKNFKQYIILSRFGGQYSTSHNQRELMNERDKKTLRNPAFLKDLLVHFKNAGLIESADLPQERVRVKLVYRDNAQYDGNEKGVTFKYAISIDEKTFGDGDLLESAV